MSAAPVRLGLIGAGPWGRKILKTVQGMSSAAIARVASRNPETAALAGPGCAVAADWRELVSAGDIDGILIATPPATHHEQACAALSAGIAVFVEKPLTLDVGQAESLLQLAKDSGGFVLVDHIHLFNPAFESLKRLAAENSPIRSIRSCGGNRGPFRADTPILWDMGPHDLSMCFDLLGTPPLKVSAGREKLEERPEGRGEIIRLRLDFPEGVEAEIRVGNLFEAKRRSFEVDCGRETLIYDDTKADKLARRLPAGPEETLPASAEPPLSQAIEFFARAIRSGSKDLSSLKLGVEVVKTLAAAEACL